MALYDQSVVDDALFMIDLFPSLSNASIASMVGVRSPETIRLWRRQDMSWHARRARIASRNSWRRILSSEQELIMAGRIIYLDVLRRDSSTLSIRRSLQSLFVPPQRIHASYISRFLKRQHLSMRYAVLTHAAERHPSKFDELVQYLDEIRAMNIPPDRIINIDATSVYSDARFVKQAGIRGRFRKLPCLVCLMDHFYS